MNVPQRYWRFPTGEAIDSLASRFGLPAGPDDMQDWEYRVADPERLGEFLAALEADGLTGDERFTLGEIVMQCFEDLAADDDAPNVPTAEWRRFAAQLRSQPAVHAFTLCYWSATDLAFGAFRVSPLVGPLWVELEPIVSQATL